MTDPDDPEGAAIKKRYGVFGPPAILFFDADGQEYKTERRYGFVSTDVLVAVLNTLE